MPNRPYCMSFLCSTLTKPQSALIRVDSKFFPISTHPFPWPFCGTAYTPAPQKCSLRMILARAACGNKSGNIIDGILISNFQQTTGGNYRNFRISVLPAAATRWIRAFALNFPASFLSLCLCFSPCLCGQTYSNRRIFTGNVFAAERAGRIVASPLIASAAATIQIASNPFA